MGQQNKIKHLKKEKKKKNVKQNNDIYHIGDIEGKLNI